MEKFNETSWPEKYDFYSHLNMEIVTDVDYMLAKRASKDFKIRNLGEYTYLYVESDALLLVDVFKNLLNMRLEIYGLHLAHFLSASWLAL